MSSINLLIPTLKRNQCYLLKKSWVTLYTHGSNTNVTTYVTKLLSTTLKVSSKNHLLNECGAEQLLTDYITVEVSDIELQLYVWQRVPLIRKKLIDRQCCKNGMLSSRMNDILIELTEQTRQTL